MKAARKLSARNQLADPSRLSEKDVGLTSDLTARRHLEVWLQHTWASTSSSEGESCWRCVGQSTSFCVGLSCGQISLFGFEQFAAQGVV